MGSLHNAANTKFLILGCAATEKMSENFGG
uniref:Uncharacterized protein n=1 Tax=viral metagenome TaxID=1070528 RepID=A0A6C0AS61_9ZZZZ